MDSLLLLRDALEQEDNCEDSRDHGILIVPFDTSAHVLGQRIAERMEYLLIQQNLSRTEATQRTFREFYYEISMCKKRLIQNAIALQE